LIYLPAVLPATAERQYLQASIGVKAQYLHKFAVNPCTEMIYKAA
jgi:hypothetical protein